MQNNNNHFGLTQAQDKDPNSKQRKNLKYELIRSLAPGDFMNIRRHFDYYGKEGISVAEFVCVMLQVLFHSHEFDKYPTEIMTLTELFIYIDHQKYRSSLHAQIKQKIKFEQFTNFVIENEGMFNNDENLDDFQITPSKQLKDIEINADGVYPMSGTQSTIAVLDLSQKNLSIMDAKNTFKVKANFSPGGALITSCYYLKDFNALVIATNDKHLSFYNLQDSKLVRRFQIPQAQGFFTAAEDKGVLYSGSNLGKLFEWDIRKIFSEFKTVQATADQHKDFLYKEHKPIKQQEDLTCMILIESIDMLVTGSNDSFIRLYEIRESGLASSKELEGHYKGIKCLTYSTSNKLIVSCAFDFDVLVWNAYLDHPVAKLSGHQAPINSVYCPHRHSIIISLDSKGIMKIWNCKSFQLMQNINNIEAVVRCNIKFTYKQELDLAIVCMKKLSFFEFSVSYNPRVTDDKEITAIRYSETNLEIYIATSTALKVWSAEKGVIVRIFKSLTQSDIVCMELDKNHRRAFLGTITGSVVSVDVFTGMVLNVFAEHLKEICFIGYSAKHSLLVTSAWDKVVKIHNDTDHLEKIDKRNNVLRNIKNCHERELILSAYSDDMLLIATSSRDPVVRLWDFEKGFFETQFSISEQIACICFLDPYPLLALADIKGNMYIFIVKYHKKVGKLLIHWKNMYSIQKHSQVTHLSSEYYNKQLHLIIGDEHGYVRIIKLNAILQAEAIVPVVVEQLGNKNPFRIEDYIFTGTTNNSDQLSSSNSKQIFSESQALLPQKMIRQAVQIKAHNQRINYVQLIRQTDSLNVLSVGYDKMCKLWNDQGVYLGSLKQGLTINDSWKFQKNETHETKEIKTCKYVIKKLPDVYQALLAKKREKLVPFSHSSEMDYEGVDHVQSNEIYRDLKEIQDYLRKNNPKSSKRLY